MLAPAPAGYAVDRADHGQGQGADLADQRIVELFDGGAEVGSLARAGIAVAQILPRAKALARTGHHDRANGLVGLDLIKRGAELPMHGLIKRIQLVGAVQRYHRHPAFTLEANGVPAHVFSSVCPGLCVVRWRVGRMSYAGKTGLR